MYELTSNSNRLSNGKFTFNKESLQNRIFQFLFQHPNATNSLLHSYFGGIDINSKAYIRKIKKKFLDKYKHKVDYDINKTYEDSDYDKDQTKKFQEIIDLYDKILG